MRASGVLSLGSLSLLSVVEAATVTYNWKTTWVSANPDGKFVRPVIGINGQWPCPKIEASVGDTVIVNLSNGLGNETVGLHFHGIDQIQTIEMDGPSGVSQCPVPPGSSIKYQFLLNAPGTYWYHSHNPGQYPDGLRGPLIVQDPQDPWKGQYDEEVILTMSDWYHVEAPYLVRNMLKPTNTRFLPPFPDSLIVNEGQSGVINFPRNKTIRVRMISYSAIASAMVHFNSHNMQVIMNDGTYTQKKEAYMIRMTPAQRYDVLLTALERENRNYPFLIAQDLNRDFTNKAATNVWPMNFTGYLKMNSQPMTGVDVVNVFRPLEEVSLRPLDNEAILGPVTKNIVLDFNFCMFDNSPRACFNGQPHIPQKVPSLYTAATVGSANSNPAVYGPVNPFFANFGDVVQIVINNHDAATHPFHLHGHQFQVVDRPGSNEGPWRGRNRTFVQTPTRRDVVTVNAGSYAVLRFRADNPGVWLFHCHIEWHVEMGLTAEIIEAPERLVGRQFPADHIENCKLLNMPYQGNAGGNTVNVTDSSNYNTAFPVIYEGSIYTPPSPAKRSRHAHQHA